MTIEVRPIGTRCNLNCLYCYESHVKGVSKPLNMERVKQEITRLGADFTLFGGEILLTPIETLRELFKFGFEKFKKNSIQTNLTLLNEEHIKLFKEYNVHVGVSLDGPGELNSARCSEVITYKVQRNIAVLLENMVTPSIIVTISAANATVEKLPVLIKWFHELDSVGIRSIRLHTMEVERGCPEALILTVNEMFHAFTTIYERTRDTQIQFDIFDEIKRALAGNRNNLTCCWNACDPYNTRAVMGIEANGESSNCGRVNKSGIDWLKSEEPTVHERQYALRNTPQEHGGCEGCKYWYICKGQCPGTAMNGDWRNRTSECEFWKRMFAYFETPDSKLGPTCESECNTHQDTKHGDHHSDHTDKFMLRVPVR